MPISIAIVEDDFRFAGDMMRSLAGVPDFVVAGHAGSHQQALALLDIVRSDVLVVDLQLPDGDGIDLIRRARADDRAGAILVFTVFGAEDKVLRAIESGADGYLLKGASETELITALRQAHAGESPISPAIARHLLSRIRDRDGSHADTPQAPIHAATATEPIHPADRLTHREHTVLQLVAQSFIADEIAARLGVTANTIRTHIRNIYSKLRVGRRVQAISEAQRRGYL